jgi:Cdc6-like AAA superfamily ATPase
MNSFYREAVFAALQRSKDSYRKFYYILEKLERLRLVDIVFGEKGKRRTRYVHAKFSRTFSRRL